MNNALALFKGLLIAAIVVVDGWALFQVVSYTLQNCHNGLAIVLMIGVGSIGVLLLTALMGNTARRLFTDFPVCHYRRYYRMGTQPPPLSRLIWALASSSQRSKSPTARLSISPG